ncbi:hypothetical protein HB904_17405 [Listeria booriae]|uniref:Uncharacterized protein n=1 Tax=Listeria booriae TaxID=1552123 RepID=A0A841YTL6_9LIST|nr:hypothetical protein [Listeria booriae]MBC1403087.1 hypothetical protein [Listeria booriae]MBC1617958.1 hypothetical protein [Listeria booriae]
MTENQNSENENKLEIDPLITTSTIKRKQVSVKGTDDFGRSATYNTPPKKDTETPEKKVQKPQRIDPTEDFRKKATKTQKLSPDVILKIEVLKPYIKELEELNLDRKPTVNDIVDMLVDHYVNTKIPARHLGSYKAVYSNLYDQL